MLVPPARLNFCKHTAVACAQIRLRPTHQRKALAEAGKSHHMFICAVQRNTAASAAQGNNTPAYSRMTSASGVEKGTLASVVITISLRLARRARYAFKSLCSFSSTLS